MLSLQNNCFKWAERTAGLLPHILNTFFCLQRARRFNRLTLAFFSFLRLSRLWICLLFYDVSAYVRLSMCMRGACTFECVCACLCVCVGVACLSVVFTCHQLGGHVNAFHWHLPLRSTTQLIISAPQVQHITAPLSVQHSCLTLSVHCSHVCVCVLSGSRPRGGELQCELCAFGLISSLMTAPWTCYLLLNSVWFHWDIRLLLASLACNHELSSYLLLCSVWF